MKKLLSLLMAFSLALVPMLSFADESSGATQNIYNMLLEELTAANLSMTPYDDINRIYLGYMLEKNARATPSSSLTRTATVSLSVLVTASLLTRRLCRR